ncbi:MAG: hypothetical protein LUH40_06505 [Clostridiales bacterium]|nr:hypothetical protein [Clostridiales bacterium]
MAGTKENRKRNKTVSFYVTQEEYIQIQARIKITGMPKGEYFIQSLLHQKICISVGKYKSDRLSLEIKKLREKLDNISASGEIEEVIYECKALLEELHDITSENQKLSADDFKTK